MFTIKLNDRRFQIEKKFNLGYKFIIVYEYFLDIILDIFDRRVISCLWIGKYKRNNLLHFRHKIAVFARLSLLGALFHVKIERKDKAIVCLYNVQVLFDSVV